MRKSALQQIIQGAALAAIIGFAAPPTRADAQTPVDSQRMDDRDDGMDLGWLGLLGLAGLLGLRRRDNVTHTDSTTARRPLT